MGVVAVRSPDGDQWEVRRRWLNRPLPDLRRRFGEYQEKTESLGDALDGPFAIDFVDSIWVTIAIVVIAVLLIFVLLPLLGVALELILILLLLSSGLVGRVVLRRPWIVEASNLDQKADSAAYAIKGWRRSGEAVAEIARAIEATGPPAQISAGVPVPPTSA